MSSRDLLTVLLVASVISVGCSSQKPGGPRFKTTPLTGIVQIDGEPTALVTVQCNPVAGTSELKVPLTAMTDDEGRFTFQLYEKGDGIPEGTYVLTFLLKTIETSLKDKFKGAYADPKNSEFKVTVVDGEPNDAGTIELSSNGPEKK